MRRPPAGTFRRAVTDLREPEAAERLAHEAPDEYIRAPCAVGRSRLGGRWTLRWPPKLSHRRVRLFLLQGEGPRFHPRRGPGLHALRPVPLLADGADAAQPRVHARGAVLRADRQQPAA